MRGKSAVAGPIHEAAFIDGHELALALLLTEHLAGLTLRVFDYAPCVVIAAEAILDSIRWLWRTSGPRTVKTFLEGRQIAADKGTE